MIPQVAVGTWLLATVLGSLWFALRPTKGWLVLTPKQQRLASLGFAAAAISEASLLVAGGFFERLF